MNYDKQFPLSPVPCFLTEKKVLYNNGLHISVPTTLDDKSQYNCIQTYKTSPLNLLFLGVIQIK